MATFAFSMVQIATASPLHPHTLMQNHVSHFCLQKAKIMSVNFNAGTILRLFDNQIISRHKTRLERGRFVCQGKAAPFSQGHAVACILIPGISFHSAVHPPQGLGQVLSFLLDQGHKRQNNKCLHVSLQQNYLDQCHDNR